MLVNGESQNKAFQESEAEENNVRNDQISSVDLKKIRERFDPLSEEIPQLLNQMIEDKSVTLTPHKKLIRCYATFDIRNTIWIEPLLKHILSLMSVQFLV